MTRADVVTAAQLMKPVAGADEVLLVEMRDREVRRKRETNQAQDERRDDRPTWGLALAFGSLNASWLSSRP